MNLRVSVCGLWCSCYTSVEGWMYAHGSWGGRSSEHWRTQRKTRVLQACRGMGRVDTLKEMSRTSSSRAFPTPLRNWEFKPPFQMKHSECANSPLKVLSWNCLRAAIILKTVFMWQLLPWALCFVITRLTSSCRFLLQLCLPNLVRLVCRRMGFDMINGPWKREEKANNTHFHSIQEWRKRLPAVKNHQIRSRFLIVSLLGDNLVSTTCRSGNNLQLCTSHSLRTHKHILNISLNSTRQRCWDIIILQLKSHLKKKHFNNLSQAAHLENFWKRRFGWGDE